MPIRMTPDRGGSQRSSRPSRPSGGRGGGGIGGALIPVLLGVLMKRPKLLLVLAVIVGALYFFGGMEGCGGGGNIISQVAAMATGANFDPALYDKAEVYEPLADNVKNPLPERMTLERYCPPRLNQGKQGSCVAWASGYAARTIIQAKASDTAPSQQQAFSPSYLYNQIKIPNSGCQGSYIYRAMEHMQQGGVLPFSRFAYTDQDCSKQPNAQEKQDASAYRIKGFQRLTLGADEQRTDMLAMKQYLSQGSPVVVGMMVGGTFMQDMVGKDMWQPTRTDYQMPGFGGHAMCVVGYDDYKFGSEGGFQIMNSWGPEWGDNGIGWVAYKDFDFFAREAYAVYPMEESAEQRPDRFDIRFGFVDNSDQRYIALQEQGNGVFRTTRPIAKGTRFKVEVTNTTKCYTYLFGEDTDGSTYVLFPYTPKHSPYCGITGTRLFPRDHSLTADDVGDTDVMAILVTNQPFDYVKVNDALNTSSATGMAAKLNDAMGDELNTHVTYTGGNTIRAACNAERNAMAIVLELEKQ